MDDTNYGLKGVVTDGNVSTYPSDQWKCNVFVGNAYAVGAGLGYGGANGYPANKSWFGGGFLGIRGKWAPAANDLANPSKAISNLSVATSGHIGDIFSFNNPGGLGHTTLNLGPGLLIYAGEFGAEVGSFSDVRSDYTSHTVRRYSK